MLTSTDAVWTALALGAVSSVGLLVGAITGSFSRLRHRSIAMAMSIGAGLLLAGVSLKIAADAIRVAGPMAAALSLLLGAAAFSTSNALLARFGAAHRKRCGECIQQPAETQRPGSGVAIALGNALDAVPEACRAQLHLHFSALGFDRHRRSSSNCGRVCWVWVAR